MTLPKQLETIQRIYTLGPPGTFSEYAASQIKKNEKQEICYAVSLVDVLEKTKQDKHAIGIVPVENSTAGSVLIVWKHLVKLGLAIEQELILPIQFTILAETALADVKNLYCHNMAYEQVREFLTKYMPSVEPKFCKSNVSAAKHFMGNQKEQAALIPRHLSRQNRIYQQYIKAEDVQDSKHNKTRFFVVMKKDEAYQFDFTRNKTSLFVRFEEDHPSLLFSLLEIFHIYDINLSYLHSVASAVKLWKYNFFIDFYNNQYTQECLTMLQKKNINFTILGCYDFDK